MVTYKDTLWQSMKIYRTKLTKFYQENTILCLQHYGMINLIVLMSLQLSIDYYRIIVTIIKEYILLICKVNLSIMLSRQDTSIMLEQSLISDITYSERAFLAKKEENKVPR